MNTVMLFNPRRKTIIEPGKQLILLGATRASVIIAEETRIHGTVITRYLESREAVINAAGIIEKIKARDLLMVNRRSKPLIVREATAGYTIAIGVRAPIIIHNLETIKLYTAKTLISSLKAREITINQQTTIKTLEKPPEKIILKTPIARFLQNPGTNKTRIIYRYEPVEQP